MKTFCDSPPVRLIDPIPLEKVSVSRETFSRDSSFHTGNANRERTNRTESGKEPYSRDRFESVTTNAFVRLVLNAVMHHRSASPRLITILATQRDSLFLKAYESGSLRPIL